ncbi:MAG: preprotein translocase subunit SecA [Gammaproteobacteria bacterium]|nr:preprotein translocase subunit SecA [Gammaproteobacteria bacterium]
MTKVLSKIFGSRNERLIKRMMGTVAQVNAFEPTISTLSDDALKAKTEEFRQRLDQGETLDGLLPEAFAVVREAAKRSLKMRHFDMQLVGGLVLHQGKIAEMRTGEGKTLVATLAAYLNALTGRGVHIVTVNDYLAQRDAEWMGTLYRFLGLSVGVVISAQDQAEKREAYAADIIYGTNNEFGFDYLRDNMAFSAEERMQRTLHFAIVDEVDSILIDEARTPLIISGPAEESTDLYRKMDQIAPKLTRQEKETDLNDPDAKDTGDYVVDEKDKVVFLTERGHERAETLLEENGLLEPGTSLYDAANISLLTHLNAALKAHNLFQREVDYIVNDNEVVIVDEFTGRMMPGRRWSEGLHQAIEAKEGAKIREENQTLASITFQNYFRLYDKLSGMTGTADTEAFEFQQIYDLEVVVIPTNQVMVRDDMGDQIFRTADEKYVAIIEDIKACHDRGQPVLVGTTSIEMSEHLSKLLSKENIEHEVLNAKNHEREAHIITQAGRPGGVTIATNMAGRGTDIVLGGNLERELAEAKDPSQHEQIRQQWQQRHDQVIAAGGLHVIGTERHESRRIDNQLRGRSGRQGDPGSSRFYLSLEDTLMRIFGSQRVSALMQRLGMEEGEAIEHPWVSKAIENAQRKVEGRNFDMRKQLLEYDDVANDQRKVIYEERNRLMDVDDISSSVSGIRNEVVNGIVDHYIPPQSLEEQWDISGLEEGLEREYGLNIPVGRWLQEDEGLYEETLRERIVGAVEVLAQDKARELGDDVAHHLEKAVMLQVLDQQWKDHLAGMDYLRQGIGLRGFAQKNPKQEYKREAFAMFSDMLERVKTEVVGILARIQVREEEDVEAMEAQRRRGGPVEYQHPDVAAPESAEPEVPTVAPVETFVRKERKVGRNEPCPCGSGKKYKQCHGKLS